MRSAWVCVLGWERETWLLGSGGGWPARTEQDSATGAGMLIDDRNRDARQAGCGSGGGRREDSIYPRLASRRPGLVEARSRCPPPVAEA